MKNSEERPKAASAGSIRGDAVVSGGAEHKRVEATRAYLASIVESSDDAILGKSIEGVIQSWNAGAERLYRYPASEIIGQSVFLLVPPDRQEEVGGFLERIKQGEAVKHYETVRVAKGGRHIHVSVTISPIKDASGEVVRASSVVRDITERKRAEGKRPVWAVWTGVGFMCPRGR